MELDVLNVKCILRLSKLRQSLVRSVCASAASDITSSSSVMVRVSLSTPRIHNGGEGLSLYSFLTSLLDGL